MVTNTFSYSQKINPKVNISSKEQSSLDRTFTEKTLLTFIKEDNSSLFKNRAEYINFLIDKAQQFNGSEGVNYAEICFRIAVLLTNNNKPYKA